MVDLHKSIVISCDTYYYGVAQDLGIDNIHELHRPVRLRQAHRHRHRRRGRRAAAFAGVEDAAVSRTPTEWFAGDTISVGIGQGYNLATPLQLAQAVSILANSGTMFRPHIVRHIQDSQTNELTSIEVEPIGTIAAAGRTISTLVRDAMVDVTRPGGTAAAAGAGAQYKFAGKTGTAQVVAMKQNEKYDERRVLERHRDHALFIAYAPADAPTIALAVLVENGGHGGSTAAPIAREVFDFYLLGKEPRDQARTQDEERSEND